MEFKASWDGDSLEVGAGLQGNGDPGDLCQSRALGTASFCLV